MILLLLAAWGCADPDAPQKCEDLVSAFCRNVEQSCPLYDISQEECEGASLGAVAECDRAVAVSDTYDDCLDDIGASDGCLLNDNAELPESCEDAVLSLE